METNKIPLNEDIRNCPPLQRRVALRLMSAEEFIEKHASGTLRKNKHLGMVWRAQYLQERTAYEFGWGFECLPRSRVTFGDAYTEGDCKPRFGADVQDPAGGRHGVFLRATQCPDGPVEAAHRGTP